MILGRSGLPGFATDIFQLIAGMFHLPPDCADIPAQLLDRAYNLLRRFPQVSASNRCMSAVLLNARAIRWAPLQLLT
jgi:hypothetical protein